MTSRIKHWLHQFLNPTDWELESYLAGAANCANCADLEHRMQEWSRRSRQRF